MTASVLLITYNHRPFIRQAIESVLAQEADFEWELLISEDYSTDGTREIVQEYAERHPNRIRLLLSARNQNDNEVVVRGLRAARGTYVALLDGDDYWTSPHKLRRQVEFLRAHPHCTICFHNAVVCDEEGRPYSYYNAAGHSEVSKLDDLLEYDYIATASAMVRRTAVTDIPSWFRTCPFGDWPVFIIAARHGEIRYLNEIMAAYRVHGKGAWSGRSVQDRLKSVIDFHKTVNQWLNFEYDSVIRRAIADRWYELAGESELAGDLPAGKEYFSEFLRSCRGIEGQRGRTVKLAIKLYSPHLTRVVRKAKRRVSRRHVEFTAEL